MTPSKIFYKIRTDKTYLLRSYLADMLVMSALILFLLKINWQINIDVTFFKVVVIGVFALINGLIVSSLLHNASHSNVSTKLFNRIVGEYCGYWVLYGFTNFSLVHILHHQHSDDEMDPVNPKGMSFIVFLSAPMRYMIKAAKAYLFSVHGKEEDYHKIMKAQTVVFHLNLVLRLAIWYIFLGNFLFLFFYIPSFLTIVTIFAHINYVCHRDHVDGSVEIVNLNHNLYYKVANFFTMGGYFHKNHHTNMKLFNPMSLEHKHSKKKLLTIQSKIYLNPNEQYIFTGSFISKYFSLNSVWIHGERNRVLAPRKFNEHPTSWL
ncbi:hypothetical protein DOM21_02050 [Bacteriovorax stolpii]|uniref:fatty acid desaturase n=1 Tax=Bacteriovorax stolpii TaxID=960 RepID=UPI001157043B|nr:fatty acid desaturase [Bacteriovorax stolpii]QDK40256.1 hypothetical protein DOM21_02050 [Bacteriovorax stolpii]